VGSRAVLDAVEEENISCSFREPKSDHPVGTPSQQPLATILTL
jgi:hypothetical protein